MQPLWKTAWQFLKMLKIELAYDPVIPLSVIYAREMKTYVHTKTWIWMNVHSSITHYSPKSGNNPKCPSTDVYTNIHTMECYSTQKGWSTDPCHKRITVENILCVRSVAHHVPLFANPWTVARQAPLSMGFSRQEYWSRLPFPTPGDLLDPGIKLVSLASPVLAGGFFTTSPIMLNGRRWWHWQKGI